MQQHKAKPRWSGRVATPAARPNARVYETAEAFAFVERVGTMEFAKLCGYFKPTTLAAIVVDLGDGPFPEEATEVETVEAQIEEAQVIAMDALVANCGEEEARALIEEIES